jgi:hypothetical protein
LVERLFDELVLVGVEVGGGFDHTMTSFECWTITKPWKSGDA